MIILLKFKTIIEIYGDLKTFLYSIDFMYKLYFHMSCFRKKLNQTTILVIAKYSI